MRSVKQDLKFRTTAGFHNGQPFTCSQPTVTAGVNPRRLHFIGKPNRIHLQRIFSFVTSQTRTHTYHPRNHPRVFLSPSALSLSQMMVMMRGCISALNRNCSQVLCGCCLMNAFCLASSLWLTSLNSVKLTVSALKMQHTESSLYCWGLPMKNMFRIH